MLMSKAKRQKSCYTVKYWPITLRMASFFKCNSWIYLMLVKCKKKIDRYIYKEDMNKGTLQSFFFCLKIFLSHKCLLKTLITFSHYKVKIFWIHVNILSFWQMPQLNLHFILYFYVKIVQITPVICGYQWQM